MPCVLSAIGSRLSVCCARSGDGGARSMICSFCVAEWEFRRIVCPGCGEENDRHLAVFTASDSTTFGWSVATRARPTSRPSISLKMAMPNPWSTNWPRLHSISGLVSTDTPSCKPTSWECSALVGGEEIKTGPQRARSITKEFHDWKVSLVCLRVLRGQGFGTHARSCDMLTR